MITPIEFIELIKEDQASDDDHLDYIIRVFLPKVNTAYVDWCPQCQHCQESQ
jgi:hypothetical protein